jgi:hypothetical protein
MKRSFLPVLSIALLATPVAAALAWSHAGYYGTASGGGGSWSAHGYRGGSASGGDGSWNANSAYGGHASGGGGSWNATSAYGGHASGGDGSWSAVGARGGTASGDGRVTTVTPNTYGYRGSYYGAYHPPTTVNYYGAGCYNCGGWADGAGVAVLRGGAAIAATTAAVSTAAAASTLTTVPPPPPAPPPAAVAAPPPGTILATVPQGCTLASQSPQTFYHCAATNTWLEPAFGANGVYYTVVTPP